jgi:hypothetical protein
MAEPEKMSQWQEMWQAHWKEQGPPAFELTAGGNTGRAGLERQLLAATRNAGRPDFLALRPGASPPPAAQNTVDLDSSAVHR